MVSMQHLREEHIIANLLKNLEIFVLFSQSGVFILILQLYLGNYLILKVKNDIILYVHFLKIFEALLHILESTWVANMLIPELKLSDFLLNLSRFVLVCHLHLSLSTLAKLLNVHCLVHGVEHHDRFWSEIKFNYVHVPSIFKFTL
jgi:hypothetical protein